MALSNEEKRLLQQAEDLDEKPIKKKKLVPPFYAIYKEEVAGSIAISTILGCIYALAGTTAFVIALCIVSVISLLIVIGLLADRRDSDLDRRVDDWKDRNRK